MNTSKTLVPSTLLLAFSLVALPAAAQNRHEPRGGGERAAAQGQQNQAPRDSGARAASPRQSAPAQAPAPRYSGPPPSAPQAVPRDYGPRQITPAPRDYGQRQVAPAPRAYGRDYGQRAVTPAPAPRAENRGYAVPRPYQAPRPDYRANGGGQYRSYGGYDRGHGYVAPRGYYGYRDGYRGYGVPSYYRGHYNYGRYYVPYRPYYFGRPYYSFRPRFSIGFGLWLGFGVPYPYAWVGSYAPPVYGYYGGAVRVVPYATSYGGVSFYVNPPEAAVILDGQYVGTVADFGPDARPLTLTPGRHHIEVQADGYQTAAWDADIVPGQVLPLQGNLAPLGYQY